MSGQIDWSILGPAFAAGLLVLATHVPLGIEVLRRGIIFIDLAVAQVAGLGVLIAHLLEWDAPGGEHELGVQLIAVAAAAAGALLLTWSERRWPEIQEALIGLLFALAASAGILMLANNPHGGEHLKDLLAGQILWVDWARLGWVAVLTAAILAAWFGAGARLGRAGFYLLFAVTVTVSVQLVGVFLVFASLIAPAVASRAWSGKWRLLGAYAAGAAGYGLGLAGSAVADLPAGAAVVCSLVFIAFAALFLGSAESPRGR